jgi:hypothetical protein
MVHEDRGQGFLGPGAGSEPVGELVVPVQVVASNQLSGSSIGQEDFGLSVVEHTLLRLSVDPPASMLVTCCTTGRIFPYFMTLAGVT